jgi:hypothetical protein
MLSRVKAGPITEFHGVYSRYVGIVCDNGVILGETLHTKNKEELYIVDDER